MKTTNFTLRWVALLCTLMSSFTTTAQIPEAPTNQQRIVDLDLKSIFTILDRAPLESTTKLKDTKATITLPYLTGTHPFKVVASSMMSPEFATRYPQIKTYAIQSVKEPGITGRLTISPIGLYATILTPQGIVAIQPTDFDPQTPAHKIYLGEEEMPGQTEPEEFCGQNNAHIERRYAKFLEQTKKPSLEKAFTYPSGSGVRTYRLAVVVTAEFYQANGASAMAVNTLLTSIVSGIQAIYYQELAVQFSLLTPFLYTNTATDPFTPDGMGGDSRTNQAAEAIALNFAANTYDIGHVFHTTTGGDGWSGGGVAGLGQVCDDDTFFSTQMAASNPNEPDGLSGPDKAAGWSGSSVNTGTGFIRLAAHEFGHQFGMTHTFNGTGGSCTASINATSAYEIGSGTTIMSYRDICSAAQNIPGSGGTADDYFHTHSLTQAINYINEFAICITPVTNGNTPPTVEANSCEGNYTLPVGTPFSLTGSATDANGDALTYTWEQYDEDNTSGTPTQGFIGNAAAMSAIAPLFRSYPPSTSPTRTFPALDIILNNDNTSDFEPLPLVDRTLRFRLTVRDNNAAGGAVEFDDLAIAVDNAYGPLAVTSPNLGLETWTAGMMQTVTWSVNNTNTLAANVVISLSIDGGNSFPFIVGTFANNGSAMFTLPASIPNTTKARIKVAAEISDCFSFFDISNADFEIISTCIAPSTEISPTTEMTFPVGDAGLNIGLTNNIGSIVTAFSGSITTSDEAGNLFFLDGTPAMCAGPSNALYKDIYMFSVDVSGSYTISHGGAFATVLNLYESPSTGSDCTNHISSSATRPTGVGLISLGSSLTANLTAGTFYTLVVSGFSTSLPTHPFNYNITFPTKPVGSNIYNGVFLPANYSYTYVAVNTATNEVALVNASSDFTALPAAMYQIYGAAYYSGAGPNPPTVDPSTWVGQTISDILSNNNCTLFSTNFKKITVESSECSLTSANLTNVHCNNDGTSVDPSDDEITFSLDPTGANLGTGYTVTGATLVSSTGSYGSSMMFTTNSNAAGDGNLTLTITDNNNPSCSIQVMVSDPGTCSNSCSLTAANLDNVECNNNGTSSDPSDDEITFFLDPTGANLGLGYTVSGATLVSSTGSYGSSMMFTTNSNAAGDGDLTLTITDNNNPSCSIQVMVSDPGTCSPDCNLTGAGLVNVQCFNNGTPMDGTDDRIRFQLNPSGFNLSAGGYTVSGATLTPTTGTYGMATTFETDAGTAGTGDLTLTITDNTNDACFISFMIMDPGTCVSFCDATLAGDAVICDGASANLVVTVTDGTGPFTVVYTDGNTNVQVPNYQSGTNIPVMPNATTTYSLVSVTDEGAGSAVCSVNSIATVTLNSLNAGSIVGSQTVCTTRIPAPFTEMEAASKTEAAAALTYRWEKSTVNCNSGFETIPDADQPTLALTAPLTRTTYFRRIAISTLNGTACEAASNCIIVTVQRVDCGAFPWSGNK